MKRHLVSSLLLASAVSGCSMFRIGSPQSSTPGAADPTAKEGDTSAPAADGKPADAAPAKDATPADVVHRIPGFTVDDSYSLAKIAEAFKLVTPDLVRYVPNAEKYVSWAPSPYETGKFFRSVNDRKFAEKDCGTAGFRIQAGYRRELEEGLCSPDKSFEHVAAGTAVVLWGTEGTDTILVTLDGGRYEVTRPEELLPRAPDAAKDPATAPLQHTFLGVAEIRKLAELDAKIKPTLDAAEATTKAYVTCNLTIFDKQEKEMEAVIKASPLLTEDAREAKLKPIGDRYRKQQEKTCDKDLTKLEKIIATFVEERNTARRKLWDDTAALRTSLAGKP